MALLYHIKRKSKSDKDYDLYCYLLDDGTEVETLREYEINAPVTVWYDEKWDKLKMKPKKLDNQEPKA